MFRKAKAEVLGPPDWILLSTALAIVALGLMMVYSTTTDLGYRVHDDSAYYFRRQIIWLFVGLAGLFVAARLPHRHWMKLSILGQPFDSDDLSTMSSRCRNQATHHRFAIQKHGTRPTFTLRAAFFGASQPGLFAQQTQEGLIVSTGKFIIAPIDAGLDWGISVMPMRYGKIWSRPILGFTP